MQNLTLRTHAENLPTRRENSSVTRALQDRLQLSEAIEAAGRMIRGYVNAGNAPKSYIGAMAELLMQYPKIVALACADPFKGVAQECKFMPTTADIVAFCDKRAHPMHEQAAREKRIQEQFEALDQWKNETVPQSLKDKAKAWLDRTDPVAQQLAGANDAENAARQDAGLQRIQEANQAVFERECKHDGIDPNKGVSPSLLKTLAAE